jgi:hypothetical protein
MIRNCICILLVPAVCLGASIVQTFDAPDTGISGLAYGGGSLWAVDNTTQFLYQLNPSDGSVIDYFYIVSLYNDDPFGLAYLNGDLYVTMTNGSSSGRIYRYNTSGDLLAFLNAYC